EGPHGIRRASGAVLGILVVVEEDAVSFLLPPFRRRQLGDAPLDLAGKRQRRSAHLSERPALLDARVDMHPARSTPLRPALETQLFEQRLHFQSYTTHLGPFDSRHGIAIDAQLVGVIEIGRAYGVRVKLDAA